MAEVKIHPLAEAEYEYALGWYFDRSIQASEGFEAAFNTAVEAVASRPGMYPLCDDIHHHIMLNRYPYRIVYRWDGETVHVLAVAHTKRRLNYWSDRSSEH